MIWRTLYSLALYAILPLHLAKTWWRGRNEPGYRMHVGERLGHYRDAVERPILWVHAVSVGEARASAALVHALALDHPEYELLVTCTTAAGRDTLKALHGESVRVAWLPYDLPGAVRRFLEHFRPRLGVLVETEVWPNLLAACRGFGVPVLLANARMSEKSARGYGRWRGLARPAFASLAAACAQSEEDSKRLGGLGVSRTLISGNMKFDTAPDEAKRAEGRAWRERLGRPVLLLASTREGEEAMLLGALPPWDGNLLVVIVPRHPRRFDEVAVLAQSRRSRGELPGREDRVHLGDTMGEMDFYFATADVAVIGGSFAPHGGQNLIEACAGGVPVVLGPHMFNFAEASRLAVEAGAAVQTADAPSALREALRLLADPAARAAMAAAGRKLCEGHRGATRRHLDICRQMLGEGSARAATRG